jgi:plastocyanin
MTFRSTERSFAHLTRKFAITFAAVLGMIGICFAVAPAQASEELVVEISIKDHKFQPDSLKLPAGQRAKIIVKNLDPTPEEFESNDIGFEKIIAGNSEATIRVKPLEPGTYIFFGEFHMDTALGHIVVE